MSDITSAKTMTPIHRKLISGCHQLIKIVISFRFILHRNFYLLGKYLEDGENKDENKI